MEKYVDTISKIEVIKERMSINNYMAYARLENIIELLSDYYINKMNNPQYKMDLRLLSDDELMEYFTNYKIEISNLMEDDNTKDMAHNLNGLSLPFLESLQIELSKRKKEGLNR